MAKTNDHVTQLANHFERAILAGEISVDRAIEALLSRPLKAE